MEAEGSIFETSEMVANFLASTNLLLDSWRLCNQANSPASGPFLVQHNGPVGLVAFSGMHDLGLGSGSYMNDMVALQEGEIGGLFSGLGRHGYDHDEAPVMVHVGLLQLFFVIYGCPSFQAQVKSLLEKSKSIILTGHSIGGAIASLTALWLLSYIQTIPSPPQILCITFGSPLLGNKSLLKSLLRQRWAGNFCHVVLKHDIIPRLLFAPLAPINTQLHCLLKLIQLSITSQSEQLPFNVTDEIKDQLFRFVLAYTEAVAKESAENMEIPAGLYWPFGNYLFYSEEGTVCVDNAEAVVKLLYLMLATGNSGSCCEDHLKYGGCVERMSFQFLMRRGFIHEDVPASSYDAGLKLAVESSGLASQESVSRQAEDSLKMVKQTGLTPSLNSARLAIALAKITPHRAQIEWYKASCDESENQMGYYDSFKRRASKRDYQVNLFRIKLASFWDNVINKIDNNELPHDFHKRRKWVNASHFYQLLVEPLDIAEYYRSGEHLKKGHYLRNGRERRHELFSKWWREKNNAVEEESKRSKLASLTQDSRFWAHVEEARELLEKVRQEKNSSNVAQLLQGIDEFEGYAKKLIDNKEVSSDVLAKNSSYSMWVEEVRELRLQMQQFPQLPSFVDAEMVPRQ